MRRGAATFGGGATKKVIRQSLKFQPQEKLFSTHIMAVATRD